MFNRNEINAALDHQRNFHHGQFSDQEVLLLIRYWSHLLDITNGVEGLHLIASHAAIQLHTARHTAQARELKVRDV